MGISKAVYDAGDIDSVVADLLLDENSRRGLLERTAGFHVDVGAADRVVELIYGLCDGEIVRQSGPEAHQR
jgi:hypothetical protein